MIEEPLFWIAAVFAVIVTGIAKGGFGGLGLFAVPIMALTISPVQAAGIMLPILIVMDWVGLWTFRKHWDREMLKLMLPGALLGIAAGGLLAGFVSDRAVLMSVGVIAVAFPVYSVFKPTNDISAIKENKPVGIVASIISGFTSFIAHAGGPPYQVYAIPQNMEPRVYAGTAVIFFAVVNFAKVLPYALLGQFDKTNLTTSLILIPLAPIGVLIGAWLLTRINQTVFYRILYALIFAVGVKLIWSSLF